MDLIHEDQIGAGAVVKLLEELKKVPLIIQLRNADIHVDAVHIAGSVDIGIHVGDLTSWLKVLKPG